MADIAVTICAKETTNAKAAPRPVAKTTDNTIRNTSQVTSIDH